MLWEIKLGENTFTVQDILDALKTLLEKIFAFVGKEEGWTK